VSSVIIACGSLLKTRHHNPGNTNLLEKEIPAWVLFLSNLESLYDSESLLMLVAEKESLLRFEIKGK
jgi:hypothetical protein